MKASKRQATIIDIANAANVSRQTVSRVLLQPSLVAEKTRKSVLEAMKMLDYRPNPVARNLVTQRTHLIGAVTTDFTGYTRDQIISGAEREAQLHNYTLFICGATSGEDGEPVQAPLLNTQRYEGLLILYRGSEADQHNLFTDIPDHVPIVTIGYHPKRERILRIVSDERSGAYLATKHLINLGHTRIAVMTGSADRYDVKERLAGYVDALSESAIPYDPDLVLRAPSWKVQEAYDVLLYAVTHGLNFTGIFAHSDLMAVGCVSALKSQGYSIPHDISVVGFDDIDIVKYIDPPLTTVKQMIFEIGRRAVELLIGSIEGNVTKSSSIILPTELVVRNSTGPCSN